MRTGLLMLAGIVTAVALAYLSIMIASLPFYPFHDRGFRDDMETGIYFGGSQHQILFTPLAVTGNSSNLNYSTMDLAIYDAPINGTENLFPRCPSNIDVYPMNVTSSPNGTVSFTVTLEGNGFVHMIGDNRFYRVLEFQEVFTQNNISINITLQLNNVPPGELWIPIWDSCHTEYVEVIIR
ncbi:hypothetical protein [Metallosphaera javensis (ex Sakai et al. 2022)]|uniref:hypothetical protein n=1 Tax=Metallosphaera javensis (ex Sakai et al. 2022) TaxID=2775498 RepID=UPI00258CC2B8|nr:MAG: hypothetical protein MjAS7_0364 [Metallosphaera javensis (ex Sakai et al. 2022)]